MTDYAKRFASSVRSAAPTLLEASNQIIDGDNNSFGVLTTQEISDEFMTDLENRRMESMHRPTGDFALFARIPEALVIKWFRQGKNVYQADIKEINKWLQREEAEKLIATRKKLF